MKINLPIIFLFFLNTLQSQNYIEYYNHCNEGDRKIYLEDHESALINFEKAFQGVPYIHTKQLEKASKCAVKIEKFDKAYQYGKKALLQGSNLQFLKDKESKKFRKTSLYKNLTDSLQIFNKLHLTQINLPYKKLVDSLHFIDQNIIRGNRTVKSDYKIDKTNFPKDLFDLDALVFNTLLEAIDKFGFPSEKKIGIEGYNHVWVILHHNLRLPENKAYLPLAIEAVKNGMYLPTNFAWMYDQSKINIGEEPEFYYGVPLPKTLTNSLKEEIDKKRRLFGIKPFSSTRIKTTGRRTVVKRIW